MRTKKDTKEAVFLRQNKVSKLVKKENLFMKLLFSNKALSSENSKSAKKWSLAYTIVLLVVLGSISFLTYQQIVIAAGDEATGSAQGTPNATTTSTKVSPVEVIGQQTITNDLGIEGGSFAGEVVSKLDVNVYSPREGVIANLKVGIGDKVTQGQPIGYLSVASEFDQIATTAEKKYEIDRTRTTLEAVNTQLNDVRNRLNARKSSAEAAKNAKINNANNAQSIGEITNQEKDERIKEADSDYSEVVTEADNDISSLIREQKEAEKDFQAAEALSKAVNGGVDKNIYAVRAGVVSGIFKNVGDYVTGEDLIAAIGITNPTLKDRCVRFKIPSNQPLPKVGDVVTITRPGEPFNKQTAEIIGVGTALDDNGQFVAEASFDEIIEWPVHSQVRVQPEIMTSNQIYVPLSAIWFDTKGITSAWIADNQNKITAYNVTTGRAVGDRIEIKDGLQTGDRLVIQPKPDFKNGDIIQETGSSGAQNTGEEVTPAGDGHGHEH